MGRPSSRPDVARIVVFVLVACAVIALDQLTKAAIRAMLVTPGATAGFIPGVLRLELVMNSGAAFSMGEGAGGLYAVLALVIAVLALGYVAFSKPCGWVQVVSLACIAGGGLGNALDRVTSGLVTDFFATTFMDFPVFNVADIFITCGVAVTLVTFLIDDRRAASESDGEKKDE